MLAMDELMTLLNVRLKHFSAPFIASGTHVCTDNRLEGLNR